MSKIIMASIGKWRVGQTQHTAAKYIRNFVHSGVVMTKGIHFEHMIGESIIVPISSIHSKHAVTYITEVPKVEICWLQQQTRNARVNVDQRSLPLFMAYIPLL